MVRKIIFFIVLAVICATSVPAIRAARADAATGSVSGDVKLTSKGAAKTDASGVVVYLVGFDEAPAEHAPQLSQINKGFAPGVLAITAGQSVDFPNRDAFFHNVFSLSPARPFDLGQYKNGESKVKAFPKAGVVEVYCNIHPDMAATILVLPNRRFAVTDKNGHFTIAGVPPGSWTLFAYDRLAQSPTRAAVAVVAGSNATIALNLDQTRTDFQHTNKYGQPYRPSDGGYR